MAPSARTVSTHLGDVVLWSAGPAQSRQTPLILLHGLLATGSFWHPFMAELPEHLPVMAPELWPFARMGLHRHEMDFQHLAEMLEALRLALALPRLHLCAQDLGNLILLRYAFTYPHSARRLVMLSPALYPDQPLPAGLRWWRRPGTGLWMSGPGLRSSLRGYYRRSTVADPESVRAVCERALQTYRTPEGRQCLAQWIHWGSPHGLFWDHPRMLRAIQSPTLIVQGDANPFIHYSQVQRLDRHLEHAQTVMLPDCGHFPAFDRPTRVSQEIRRFLPEI